MNIRRFAALAVALLVAAATAYVVDARLAGRRPVVEAPAAPAAPVVVAPEILVAKADIAAGTFLKAEHLAWRPWPEDGIIDAYLVKGKVAATDLEGAVVRAHLYAGEPITAARVVHPGEQGFLAAVLDAGQRAVTIPVDATAGVAGLIFPGDSVDVLFTLKRGAGGEGEEAAEVRQFSQTLLGNIRVLAIDQSLDNANGAAKLGETVTLQVTPRQAEQVALAMSMGTLSLSLRSLSRVEASLGAPGRANGPFASDAPPAGSGAHSYTRDADVMFMIGDPLGLPPPLSLRRKVEVMRGSESKRVRF